MLVDRLLPGFADEMEKIAVSSGLSHFQQQRRGRRPIRASKVLSKESRPNDQRNEDGKSELDTSEAEGGQGLADGGVPG